MQSKEVSARTECGDLFFLAVKKESAITAKALSVMAVRSRPRFPAGAGLNHRFPRVQKKKVVRSLQCTQNFLVV